MDILYVQEQVHINLVINSRTFSEDSKRIIFEKIREYEPLA